jgi:hypothetical protein
MKELLLSGGAPNNPEPTGDVLFLYDPETSKDLISGQVCVALSGGAAVDNITKIDGKGTLKLVGGGSQGLITFPTPLSLEVLSEWTVEWVSRPISIQSGYVTEMFIDTSPSSGYPIGCRWPDGGYGNRAQFNLSNWANENIWHPPFAKAAAEGNTIRWAMVYKGGLIRIYKDGIKQSLAAGTSGIYDKDFISKTVSWPVYHKIYLGYFNGTNSAWTGNFGRLRISNFARYLANYTPVPF